MGFLSPCFRMESITKLVRSVFFCDSGVDVWCCSEISGTVFLIFVALETAGKLIDFPGGTGSKAGRVALVNHVESSAFKAFQTVTADLQPAASGPMPAQKRPIWTDDS